MRQRPILTVDDAEALLGRLVLVQRGGNPGSLPIVGIVDSVRHYRDMSALLWVRRLDGPQTPIPVLAGANVAFVTTDTTMPADTPAPAVSWDDRHTLEANHLP